MIRLEHISYGYRKGGGRESILSDVDAVIRPGELTVLLGANGAGKSSLLRILSGEKKPDAGTVWFHGQSIHSLSPGELALQRAVLTQHYATGLAFTSEEVVMMGRYPHFSVNPMAADKLIVRECLEEMQVAHLSDRPFNTLSGGEQQRVQMARVLAQLRDQGEIRADRKLLLLDEPTASMDWLHQQLSLQKARELAAQGYAVVVVLHDLNLAAQFGDSLILLKRGKILARGTSHEVLQPDLINIAYGICTGIIYPEQCDFPVIIPVYNSPLNKKTNGNDHSSLVERKMDGIPEK